MADPTTANIGLAVPTRGSDVGTWDVPLNNDMTALDGYQGGVLNLSLAAATTITLTIATGAVLTPGSGPFQSANSLFILSGTLTGNQVIQVQQPGTYRFRNNCTVGTSYVQIKPSTGTGLAVGIPDGEQWHVHFDGINCSLLGLPHVAALIDLCVSTTPAWMNAFTIAPYLLTNGAIYSVATFPVLGGRLGSTFGGNGVTTFGVPDYQNRNFIPMDFGSNNRITVAGAGIDGTTFGATGGSQALQSHNHASPAVIDPGHVHVPTNADRFVVQNSTAAFSGTPSGSGGVDDAFLGQVATAVTGITLAANVGTTGSGSSGNIPPGIVGGMRFIKT